MTTTQHIFRGGFAGPHLFVRHSVSSDGVRLDVECVELVLWLAEVVQHEALACEPRRRKHVTLVELRDALGVQVTRGPCARSGEYCERHTTG